ncbi:MAG TPA: hypothetical protein VF772_23665 [Terriglobales bacterium]
MSSSEDALRFFKEWMNLKTKLAISMVLEGVVVGAVASIGSVEEHTLQLADASSRFGMLVPLTNCIFERADPERDKTDLAGLDELVRESGLKFGWRIVLPSNDEILLLEFGE